MHFLSPLTSLPILMLTSLTTAAHFHITSFHDSGSPHSTIATLSFNVSAPNLASTYCFASQSIQPSIATTPFPTNCTDPSVAFGLFAGPANGYYLTLAHVRTLKNGNVSVDAGTVFVGGRVVTYENPFTPTGNFQYLDVPAQFDVALSHNL